VKESIIASQLLGLRDLHSPVASTTSYYEFTCKKLIEKIAGGLNSLDYLYTEYPKILSM
jgi:hypothetical protein